MSGYGEICRQCGDELKTDGNGIIITFTIEGRPIIYFCKPSCAESNGIWIAFKKYENSPIIEGVVHPVPGGYDD